MKKETKKKIVKYVKRGVIVCASAGVLCAGVLFGTNIYMEQKVKDDITTGYEGEKKDCIIVLGAGIWDDGTPMPVLRDRLDKAIELYDQGVSDRLLMTGDHGRADHNEVRAMKEYAMDHGVPEDAIFMDHAGFSTYESMYRANEIFEVESAIVVTQPFHQTRSVYLAQGFGIDAVGVPCKDTRYSGSWTLEYREKLARTKDFFSMIFHPEPTYLGEKIPISGSGLATEDQVK